MMTKGLNGDSIHVDRGEASKERRTSGGRVSNSPFVAKHLSLFSLPPPSWPQAENDKPVTDGMNVTKSETHKERNKAAADPRPLNPHAPSLALPFPKNLFLLCFIPLSHHRHHAIISVLPAPSPNFL